MLLIVLTNFTSGSYHLGGAPILMHQYGYQTSFFGAILEEMDNGTILVLDPHLLIAEWVKAHPE
jgi:hypothetical protein